MKSKVQPVTLENIGKLIDRKLVPVFGELDDLKQQVEAHRGETKKGFHEVYDAIQDAIGEIDGSTDRKIKEFEKRVFAS